MSKESGLPLDQVHKILKLNEQEQERMNALRRSSEEEISMIEAGVARIFGNDNDTELTTKEMAREIGVSDVKQGNLARISKMIKQLRLTHQKAAA
jgi:DNA-binding transcriptional MerR regulator